MWVFLPLFAQEMTLLLLFLLLPFVWSCEPGRYEVQLIRIYALSPSEEAFKLYEGSSAAGVLKFSSPTVSYPNTYVYTVCLAPVQHCIVMTDTYGDGWTVGSSLTVKIEELEFGTFTLSHGYTSSALFSLSGHLLPNSMWQYSNVPQLTTEWTTANVTWEAYSSFPSVTTVTRYFRSRIHIPPGAKSFTASVNTDTGFRFYVNGKKLYDWNLPSGAITPSSYALSSVASPVDRTYSSIVGALSQSPEEVAEVAGEAVEIAVEVHATEGYRSEEETFDCYVHFIYVDELRLIDGRGWFEAEPATTGMMGSAMLFDGATTTQWSFSTSLPLEVWSVWRFGNGARRVMSMYSLSTGSGPSAYDCVSWRVSGSDGMSSGGDALSGASQQGLNGVSREDLSGISQQGLSGASRENITTDVWVTLDEQHDVVWGARRETQSFRVANYYAFRAYKFECLATAGADAFQMSEWNLVLASQEYRAPGIAYADDAFTWVKNMDRVALRPTTAGYTRWTLVDSGGAALPAGLAFNPGNGAISGIPLATMSETTFTVSAVFVGDGESYATTLRVTVIEDVLPLALPLIATKTQHTNADETWTLLDDAENPVMQSATSTPTTSAALPPGDYTLRLQSASNQGWAAASFLTLSTRVAGRLFTLEHLRPRALDTETLRVSLRLPLGPAAVSPFRVLADGSLPAGWSDASFDDTAWPVLDDANRPAAAHSRLLFRGHFAGVEPMYHGFELHLKTREGVLAYLNGRQVYARFLEAPLSADSVATGGAAVASWRTVTGSGALLSREGNVVAVALVQRAEAPVDFDMFVRLVDTSDRNPRYWDISCSSNSYANPGDLFDEVAETRVVVPKTDGAAEFTLHFNDRAEFVNKYCLTTGRDSPQADPSWWTVSGSNDGESFAALAEEHDVLFESRARQYCFTIPAAHGAFSFYRLSVTATAASSPTLSLAGWSLLLENPDKQATPPLSFSPGIVSGYVGFAFPGVVCSSDLFTGFAVTPALPAGLVLYTNTGIIKGVPTRAQAATVFTLTAVDNRGNVAQTTVTISISTCAAGLNVFQLHFQFEAHPERCGYALKDRVTGGVVDERASFRNFEELTIPFCRPASTFVLVLKKSDLAGWGGNRVSVVLVDGTTLLTESLAAGVTEKEYAFNPAYELEPLTTEWSYLLDGSEPPSEWNVIGSGVLWRRAVPGAFPAPAGVTQYFRKEFKLGDLSDFALLDVTVMVRAGAVVYLNGREIRRYNMPEDTVTSRTRATAENVVPTTVITGEYVLRGVLVKGWNMLAVELHAYGAQEEASSFDASAILVLDNMFMMKNGRGSTSPSRTGNNGSDKVFDNNSATQTVLDQVCVGASLVWEFDHNRREPISNYALVSGDSCNIFTPSGWSLQGSNDGELWQLLQQKSGVVFDAYRQQRRFDVFNTSPFSMYRLEVTECANPALTADRDGVAACGSSKLQLTDFYLFSKRIEVGYCKASGDFQPAMEGDFAYADCPAYYQGHRYRLCLNGTFSAETDNCSPRAPVGIIYENNTVELVERHPMTPLEPRVIGKDFSVMVQPALPKGLQLDRSTGVISGTPVKTQPLTPYTVTVTNVGGSETTVLEITIIAASVNYVLIVITCIDCALVTLIVVLLVRITKVNQERHSLRKGRAPI